LALDFEPSGGSNLQMTLWMSSATVETFDAIERLEPDAVLTSEAPLMRRRIAW
jgi:hypothetical protein